MPKPSTPTVLAIAVALCGAAPPARADPPPRWIANLNAVWMLPRQGATVTVAGREVPGASSRVDRAASVRMDVSWFVAPERLPGLALNLSAGIPPRITVHGSGAVAALGAVASVRTGAVVSSLQYHLDPGGRVAPYVGAGVHRTMFVGVRDGSLFGVRIDDAFGAAVEAGVHVAIDARWGLHVAAQRLFLTTTLRGTSGGRVVTSRSAVDPTNLDAGISLRF